MSNRTARSGWLVALLWQVNCLIPAVAAGHAASACISVAGIVTSAIFLGKSG